METIKRYVFWLIVIILVVEGILLKVYINKYHDIDSKWKTAVANSKSYDELLSASKKKNVAFQFTTEQLANVKDSLLRELENTRKQLKVKDKELKAEQYISSTFIKRDTITQTDTIFKDKTVAVDTVIGDKWYNVSVSLRYPSTMVITPTFKSEKNIIVSSKRETVNPPKKLWILRVFQKRHTVLHIDVIEKNPYITNQESRYVEIIK